MSKESSHCRVASCSRRATRVHTEGTGRLCEAHYQRVLRVGDVMADKPLREQRRGFNIYKDGRRKECKAKACKRPARSRGYCHMHWKRKVRNNGTAYDAIPAGTLNSHKARVRLAEFQKGL